MVCGLIVVGVVGVLSVLALRDAMAIRDQASAVVTHLQTLENHPQLLASHEGRLQVEQALGQASDEAANTAKAVKDSFALSIIGEIPYLGRSTRGAAELAQDASTTAGLLKGLVVDADQVDPQTGGRLANWGKVKVLGQHATTTAEVLGQLELHGGGVWGPVGGKRAEFNRTVDTLRHRLQGIAAGGSLAMSMFGIDRPAEVLVLASNNAEMRAEGAFLSYALLEFSHGSIVHVRTGSLSELEQSRAITPYPPTAAMLVNNGSTRLWSAINMTANFSWTGEVAALKLQSVLGKRPDYVVGADVVTMQELLGAVGEVKVAGLPQPLSKSNVAPVLLRSLYQRFSPDQRAERLAVLSQVAAAAITKAFEPTSNFTKVAQSLAVAMSGRHLLLWSGDPDQEQAIRTLGASGELDQVRKNSTFSVAVESAVAAKMDAYDIATSLSYRVVVQPDRSATVDLAVTVTNNAPKNLRPGSYIYGPDGWNSHLPGQYLANVFVWSPEIGAPATASRDGGLALRATSVNLLPGASTVVHFYSTLSSPPQGQALTLRLIPQPRLQSTQTRVELTDGDVRRVWKFPLISTKELELPSS